MEEDDFESLLDAAFGIDNTPDDPSKAAAAACNVSGQQTQCDSRSSLDPSPAASPVHMYPSWAPAGSPCLSDASMQMHASPLHDKSSSGEQQYDPQLLYSPVRQGSPSPDEGLSPVLKESDQQVIDATQQQQHDSLAWQHSQLHHSQVGTGNAQAQQQHVQAAGVHIATAQHAHPASGHQHLSLCALPREVQMRVLCCLSADSLTSLAQTSCQFSSLCSEPVLWRRLFVHRWGKNVQHNNAQNWKVGKGIGSAVEVFSLCWGMLALSASSSASSNQHWKQDYICVMRVLARSRFVPCICLHLLAARWQASVLATMRVGCQVSHSSTAVQVRYMDRDAAELQAAGAGAQDRDVMQDIFLQVSRQLIGIGLPKARACNTQQQLHVVLAVDERLTCQSSALHS